MATTARTLLLPFLSVLSLTLYRATAFCDHLPSPCNNESNQNETESAPTTTNAGNGTRSDLLIDPDEMKNMFCNLEPAWPAKYEKDVVMLTGKNFSDFVEENRYVLVFFYIYWCPPCEKMAAEYAAAAKLLKGEAAVAMIDAFVEEELKEKHNVTEYPMVFLYVGGVKLHRFVAGRRSQTASFSTE
ncbi:Protein disulfide-isomerase [Melia azedarach]|uniref:Protein disulfide-isomerase n=1 Tax=Melia azedarach TaxID=155640 RepID=A0ACC1YBJ1_MELAZ|nr:Protein disulfide-isomerase [Melia azedarach]